VGISLWLGGTDDETLREIYLEILKDPRLPNHK